MMVSVGPQGLQAQDPIFSQYYANPLYLNPALAGYDEGLVVNTAWREQWWRIDGVRSGYSSNLVGASLNLPEQRSGLGISYLHHSEGPGRLNWQRAGLAYAFRTRSCGRKPRGEFNLGMRVSVNWHGLNGEDAFTFGDQHHPIRGAIYQTAAPQALLDYRGKPFADLDAGMYYTYRTTKNRRGDDNSQYLRVGMALHHLSLGTMDIPLGRPDILPLRYTLHGDYVINQGGFQLIPMVKIEGQAATSTFSMPADNSDSRFWYWSNQVGVAATALGDIDRGFWGGVWYHGRLFPGYSNANGQLFQVGEGIHSLIVAVGGEVPLQNTETRQASQRLRFGLSYDYQFRGLTNNGNGTLELSLGIMLDQALKGTGLSCRSGPPCANVPF
jgi:type IX secretion system PorP/SprF family membrane protein